MRELELRLNHLYILDLRPRKFTIKNVEEVSKWLERGSSGEEENGCETPSTSTATGITEVMDTGTPGSGNKNGSPNVRMGQKRTINSPVTIKKLLPIKKLKKKEIERKPVGIKKAQSKILTSTPCRKLIEENHEKKTLKRLRKSQIAKKIEEFKKVAKKEREEKKQQTKKVPAKKAAKKVVKNKKVIQSSGRRPQNT